MDDKLQTLLRRCEQGKMDRRQLFQALGITATAAFAMGALPKAVGAFAQAAAPGGGKTFPVTTMNHLSLAVADYARSRDFYVDLFGMRVRWDDGKGCEVNFGDPNHPNGLYIRPVAKPGTKADINHFAPGTPNFMANKMAMKTEMERRHLDNIKPDGDHGWISNDPSGYMLNTWVPEKDAAMYPGAAGPCVEAASAKCKDGFAAGRKNLAAAPKPSGKGFVATSFSDVVLNVPAAKIPAEKEFYTNALGMKVLWEKPKEVALRFGKNTLIIQPTANAGDKPYCNHFGMVIDNFDAAKVEAELKRRGLNPKPDTKLAWTITDPDGFRVEVAGWGYAEGLKG